MKSELITLIEVPTTIKGDDGQPKRSIGTGYPIKTGLVITARHVLYHKDIKHGERTFSWRRSDAAEPYHQTKVTQDDIVFEDEGLDIALVRCDTSKLDLPLSILGGFLPEEGEGWKSRGYPRAGLDSGQRQQVRAGGEFTTTDQTDRILDLRSKDEIASPEFWKGMSGAPIFDVRRNQLIGVWIRGGKLYEKIVSEDYKSKVNPKEIFKDRLVAMSLPYLLRSDDGKEFREKILDSDSEWVQGYFDKVTKWLGQHKNVQDTIWVELSKTNENLKNLPQALVSQLKTMSITELFDVMWKIQSNNSNATVKKEVSLILRRLLPAFYEPGCILGLFEKKQSSGMVIGIPCCTEVSAEMLMAAVDQREVNFVFHSASKNNSRKIAYPGKYRLSLPPESGSVSDVDVATMMEDDLVRRFGLDSFDVDDVASVVDGYLYEDLVPRQRPGLSAKEKKIAVQRELKRLANDSEQGTYYWLFTYEHEQASEGWRDVAIKIGQEYPQVTCLSLEDNFYKQQDEEDLFAGLHAMLTSEAS